MQCEMYCVYSENCKTKRSAIISHYISCRMLHIVCALSYNIQELTRSVPTGCFQPLYPFNGRKIIECVLNIIGIHFQTQTHEIEQPV